MEEVLKMNGQLWEKMRFGFIERINKEHSTYRLGSSVVDDDVVPTAKQQKRGI